MTGAQRWLAAAWPLVRPWLPAAPARVVEIGCGPLGGFVPQLVAAGYDAIGVDPEAPDGDRYDRVAFERAGPYERVSAIVASTSLHHVAEPEDVVDRIARTLLPTGRLIVLEWAWERFDEATAAWCFRRLAAGGEEGWLHGHRDRWRESGLPWPVFLEEWAQSVGLHRAETLLRLIDARFDREHLSYGPCFFPDLDRTTAEDEAAAIEAGEIQATRVEYVGSLPRT